MSINYFCSGFNKEKAFWDELGEQLRNDLIDTKRIVYIPASNKEEKIKRVIEEKMPIFREHFKKVGIEFQEEFCITPETEKEEAQSLVKDSNMIMLMGGNPFHQKNLLEAKGLTNLLKNYSGVILGFSAGAMNMSKYIVITPCSEEYPDFDVREGLNLSNISIFPHNNFDGEEYPEVVYMGDETTIASDLNIVAKEYGNFYCLQDHTHEDGTTSVSLIRTTKDEMVFLTDNDGKVWEVTPTSFDLVDTKKKVR